VEALYGHLGVSTGRVEEADLAVLFKPSFRAAWQARGARRRVGLATDGRWWLLTDALVPAGPHRLDDYAALAAAAGHPTVALPALPATQPSPVDPPPGAVLLLPGGRSTATTGWPHHRALADALAAAGRPPFFAGGPDERAAIAAIAGPHPVLDLDAIPAFVAAIPRFSVILGHDAGLSHLAAAALRGAGQDVGRLQVIFASTDPARTGPPGATAIVGPRLVCTPCYRKACPFGLGCADLGLGWMAWAHNRAPTDKAN
jgi:ADP-heptose:LPS heptosyltransferase